MLWSAIYNFFVMHIFGGYAGSGDDITAYWAEFGHNPSTGQPYYTSKVPIDLFGTSVSFGNYLSLIATIITVVIIVTLCALFIWKIIKLIGGLIR